MLLRISCYRNLRILKKQGATIGTNCWFAGDIDFNIHPDANIIIGDEVVFTSGNNINPLCSNIQGSLKVSSNGKLIIGENSGLSSAHIWVKELVSIGKNVNIGADCIILDNDCHSLNWMIRSCNVMASNGESVDYQSAGSSPIYIGDNVLVGTRCIILKGATIGDRSVIGAGSIVTTSIPPDCIAAGNPCRVLKKLTHN